MLTRLLLAALCAALVAFSPVMAGGNKPQVDLLLVLAADSSGTIGEGHFDLQRKGYAEAITNPRAIQAMRSGPTKRIALAYLEWSGPGQQVTIADWTIIDGNNAAQQFAATIVRARRYYHGQTHVGLALQYSLELLGRAPFAAERKIIDVSGDGDGDDPVNSKGWRDHAVRNGVVINALVVADKTIYTSDALKERNANGEQFYRQFVAGGPGSFVMAADSYELFGVAIRKKLIAEVASR